ncbi:hypothetical protein M419DRAFT_120374 [Trichoderma reesei RUT C-30]|uniref:Uncharacterized protein n=1 Tax=Hypocrea jecorina (strain ATCC 56765 / BCRC 32924 / NRRL 11460 / Rut C-30) TaxID=1344414 RepID=A0A024S2U6_HYPJR|nr:hypothetical protein M419DRAFT_120374 [Trichoderma reesei RUT C-30]
MNDPGSRHSSRGGCGSRSSSGKQSNLVELLRQSWCQGLLSILRIVRRQRLSNGLHIGFGRNNRLLNFPDFVYHILLD